ncbi:endopeptidase La [Mycoplasmopsis opalescens]|uniref:endopeptidase La n=1 Tax=Mycoplasmopsis opalescens TaxID=114886 RepID=UPI0006903338|nr:endopeptidase La [Mycoplasmopsis opalescens]
MKKRALVLNINDFGEISKVFIGNNRQWIRLEDRKFGHFNSEVLAKLADAFENKKEDTIDEKDLDVFILYNHTHLFGFKETLKVVYDPESLATIGSYATHAKIIRVKKTITNKNLYYDVCLKPIVRCKLSQKPFYAADGSENVNNIAEIFEVSATRNPIIMANDRLENEDNEDYATIHQVIGELDATLTNLSSKNLMPKIANIFSNLWQNNLLNLHPLDDLIFEGDEAYTNQIPDEFEIFTSFTKMLFLENNMLLELYKLPNFKEQFIWIKCLFIGLFSNKNIFDEEQMNFLRTLPINNPIKNIDKLSFDPQFVISLVRDIEYSSKEDKSNIRDLKLSEEDKAKEKISRDLDKEIDLKMKENMEKQQREYMLREKIKVMREKLGETTGSESAGKGNFAETLKDEKQRLIYPESVIKLIDSEIERKDISGMGPDANIAAAYIKLLKELPWRKTEVESLDISKVKEILNRNHYGLNEVKERIIEYISLIINHKNLDKLKNENKIIPLDKNTQIDLDLFKDNGSQGAKVQTEFNNVPILTLVGPPGVGKTSLARAIAEALNKSFVKISLGGLNDESEIRGHRRTYVGAMPGKIIKALHRSGVSNPIILLDEIDKMTSNMRGDPTSAMLEVLDPEQNAKFQDNYLEHEYDLSKILFIATANYIGNIPAALLDRVEIIELYSYTISEKIKIAREHLIDIALKQAGLDKQLFNISDEVLEFVIKHYTAESGVRQLKRVLDKLARKIVTKVVSGEKLESFTIDIKIANELLGTPLYTYDKAKEEAQVGIVNGLAFTSIGGSTLKIEVIPVPSKTGGIKLTGSLKDVMKESANIAFTYVQANAKKYGIEKFDFDKNVIHIHVPEGAVPKDGPSAGVTFTTAIISALSGRAVPQDIAMTGEITLRGRVLEIGGLKEKSFAAYKSDVKTVFIPKSNEKNLRDISDEVKDAVKFIPVEKYEQIYELVFNKK